MDANVEALTRAVKFHQARQLEAAAQIYQKILATHPQHADALHLLGLAEFDLGNTRQGVERIQQAIALRPNDPVFHRNLGMTYQTLLDPERALICFGRCIQLWVPNGHSADYLGVKPGLPTDSPAVPTPEAHSDLRNLYLDLLKRCLTNLIYRDMNMSAEPHTAFDLSQRYFGMDWPAHAHTMIGAKRLENIQFCAHDVIASRVPGDFLEAGVWRGGATIFMRAILKAYDVIDRNVWVADSFEGVPPTNPQKYPEDARASFSRFTKLAVSLEQVQEHFRRYDLLDDQVRFIKGWFRDTLPTAPIERLALLRLDGDLYESTMDGLVSLYPKLSRGGYVIIDDFINLQAVQQAVLDYRRTHDIADEIRPVDWSAVFWKRT